MQNDKILLLISGACGSGKSSLARIAQDYFSPDTCETASLSVDTFYTMMNPSFLLRGEESEPYWTLARKNCCLIADSLFENGFSTIVIEGNSLYMKRQVQEVLETIISQCKIFHFTLDPHITTVQERVVQRGADKTPAWLEGHVEYMRAYYASWTTLVDNTNLTPVQTWEYISHKMLSDSGRITMKSLTSDDDSL